MNQFTKRMAVLAAMVVLLLTGCSSTYPHSRQERELTGQITQLVLDNMTALDAVHSRYQEGIAVCCRYVDGGQDEAGWREAMEAVLNGIHQQAGVPVSQELLDACQDSPFSQTELSVLSDYVGGSREDCADQLEFLMEFLSLNADADPLYCKLILDDYAQLAREELLVFWYGTNEFLAPITDPDVRAAFAGEAQKLSCFGEIAKDLASSAEEARRLQENHLQQMERLVDEQALLTGQMQGDLNTAKDDLKNLLIQKLGMSEDRAQALVEQILRISAKEQLLEAKKREVEDMQKQLETLHQQMREKFAPLPEDDAGILWAKAKRFAGVNMYEDAAGCLELLKDRRDADFSAECCEAGMVFYSEAPAMGYPYGVMVLMPPPEGDMAPYQVADVLVSINGQPVYGVDSYEALADARKTGYTAQVLRITDTGTMALTTLEVPGGVVFYYTDLVENAGQESG